MAWGFVQSKSGTGSLVTSLTVVYGSNLNGANKLVAASGVDTTGVTCTSVKDAAANSFTQLRAVGNGAGTKGQTALWGIDCPAVDAGTGASITATYSASSHPSLLIQEVSGLLAGNTTAMIDGTAGTTAGTTTGNIGPPSYTSTASNEYLIYVYGDDGPGANTVTTPTGYTLDANSISNSTRSDIRVAYKNSTNGTETGQWNITASPSWGLVLGAFKLPAAAAAGPGLQPVPPGLQSPMVLAVPAMFSIPPAPQQQPAPSPQLVPPGLQSPMSLTVPATPAMQAPPQPPEGTPAPQPVPPGLQSPMVLAVPAHFTIPPAPQQQPAPSPQLIPPGLQSPMSLGVPTTPATAAPPPPPVTTVASPPPLLTPPGLQSPMVLAEPLYPSQPAPPLQQPAPSPQLIPPGLASPMSLGVPARPATQAPPAPTVLAQPGYHSLTPPGRLSPMSIGLGLYAPSPGPGIPPVVPVVAVVRAALAADYDGKSWWKKRWILRL